MQSGKSYYGVIGNGETLALIGPDLSISWLCGPRVDSPPVFAKALDPVKGGALKCLTELPVSYFTQEYLPETNVLRTTAAFSGLAVRVLDYMPWGKSCLIREMSFRNRGNVPLKPNVKLELKPVRSFRLKYPQRSLGGGQQLLMGKENAFVMGVPGWKSYGRMVSIGLLEPGEERTIKLVIGMGDTIGQAQLAWEEGLLEKAEDCINFWRDWMSEAFLPQIEDAELLQCYQRSLLTLKLLTYEPTGAILAAGTSSFPAIPGGSDNWDYRFCWLRDGYYAAMAYNDAGMHREARRFYEFVCLLQEADGSWAQPLYTVNGGLPEEYVVDDLKGPDGEIPIRFGNKAAEQLQLDNVGNIVHGIWYYYEKTGDLDFLSRRWENIRLAAGWLEKTWARQEHGIWEIRERMDHWVHGKTMCYAALLSAAQAAEELKFEELAGRWRKLADLIKQQVITRGWSNARRAYLRHYGDDAPLDSSVLALSLYGLLPADDRRMRSTVQAIETSMEEGGLDIHGGIARFEGAALPFYLTTLWVARYHLRAGNLGRARELLLLCAESATNLGLMAEHFDPLNSAQYGNFPQAFSHEELIRTIVEMAEIYYNKKF